MHWVIKWGRLADSCQAVAHLGQFLISSGEIRIERGNIGQVIGEYTVSERLKGTVLLTDKGAKHVAIVRLAVSQRVGVYVRRIADVVGHVGVVQVGGVERVLGGVREGLEQQLHIGLKQQSLRGVCAVRVQLGDPDVGGVTVGPQYVAHAYVVLVAERALRKRPACDTQV